MRHLRLVAVNLAVLAGLLIVIEGLAGYGSFVRGYLTAPDLAERRHTQYDPLLGWINTPNAFVPDMYGPGVFLRINGQGFRNDRDFARAVPAGRRRVICSGDSFTLGYGVDNDHTWCQQLEKLRPGLETVNMGQGGYGVDQAYLWYQRDGALLDHHVQIFAFINDDLGRVSAAALRGYGKPLLTVENGKLAISGVPVPGPKNPRVRRLLEQTRQLRTVGALMRLREQAGFGSGERADAGVAATLDVIAKILADLKRLNDERASRLILVHLPTEDDLRERDTEWVPTVEREARSLAIPYIDLLEDFNRLTPSEASGLFVQRGELDYPGSQGHYTVRGNALVATLLIEKLDSMFRKP